MDRWNLFLSGPVTPGAQCEQEDSSHFKNTIKCLWRPCYPIQTQMQNCLFSLTSDNVTLSCLSCTNTWIKREKKTSTLHREQNKTSFLYLLWGKIFHKETEAQRGTLPDLPPQLLPPLSFTNFHHWGFPLPLRQNLCPLTKRREQKKSPVLRTYWLPTKRQQWFL